MSLLLDGIEVVVVVSFTLAFVAGALASWMPPRISRTNISVDYCLYHVKTEDKQRFTDNPETHNINTFAKRILRTI